MAPALIDYRLVFIGPARGQTAVGDYAEDFVNAVRPHFDSVVEVRTRGALSDGVRGIRQYRNAVLDAIADARSGRVLVHAELAAGAVGAFWSMARLPGIPVTATIHDPPQGIWWPAGIKPIAKHRVLFHAIHYPLRRVSTLVEGAVNGRRTLFALTETGRRSITRRYPHTNAVYIPHLVRDRRTIRAVQDRPKAVGFFGHVYRGKGFDHIAGIRAALPDDILIRVAGRGTESLARAEGIDIVGPVDGADEDGFFESVRAIVMPYEKRHWYDETYPGSGVVAHAIAYRTPVVCTAYGSLAELNEKSGAVVVHARRKDANVFAMDIADAITSVVNDRARLTELGEFAEKTAHAHSAARTAEAFAACWSELLAHQGV